MYIMYYVDKIKVVIENLFFECTKCFYKRTEREEEDRMLLELEKLWEL